MHRLPHAAACPRLPACPPARRVRVLQSLREIAEHVARLQQGQDEAGHVEMLSALLETSVEREYERAKAQCLRKMRREMEDADLANESLREVG